VLLQHKNSLPPLGEFPRARLGQAGCPVKQPR
jgi:hypothetical protein